MTEQVADRPELLQLMLDDLAASPAAFKPTNYWSVYERRFLPELVARGLRDFRRRHESVLSSFGATDFRPRGAYVDLSRSRVFGNRVTQHLPGWKRLLSRLNDVLNRDGMSAVRLDVYECGLRELQESAFRLTQLYGEHAGARALDSIELSSAGNPEDVFEIAGRAYTMRALYYYLRYAYCCQFVDFDEIDLMVELGSGMGRQIEIVRKLHPRIRVIAFDIPPQLYVCSQFLSAVFPDAVIGYETTRTYRALPDFRRAPSRSVAPGCSLSSATGTSTCSGTQSAFRRWSRTSWPTTSATSRRRPTPCTCKSAWTARSSRVRKASPAFFVRRPSRTTGAACLTTRSWTCRRVSGPSARCPTIATHSG